MEKKTTLYVLIYVNQYQPMITSMSSNTYVYEDVAAVQFHFHSFFLPPKFFFTKKITYSFFNCSINFIWQSLTEWVNKWIHSTLTWAYTMTLDTHSFILLIHSSSTCRQTCQQSLIQSETQAIAPPKNGLKSEKWVRFCPNYRGLIYVIIE